MRLTLFGVVLFSVSVAVLADEGDEGPVTPPSACEGNF